MGDIYLHAFRNHLVLRHVCVDLQMPRQQGVNKGTGSLKGRMEVA